MTQEEFINVLNKEKYSYEIEGDKIIVTHEGHVSLKSVTSLPPGVVFGNDGIVNLQSLTSIPSGVEFRNVADVWLSSLIGGFFNRWKGNIEVIDNTRLLNVMIKQGVFER